MTPKEKAIVLVTKFTTFTTEFYPNDTEMAVECAIVLVDEILEVNKYSHDTFLNYWQEVKQEIEKL